MKCREQKINCGISEVTWNRSLTHENSGPWSSSWLALSVISRIPSGTDNNKKHDIFNLLPKESYYQMYYCYNPMEYYVFSQ